MAGSSRLARGLLLSPLVRNARLASASLVFLALALLSGAGCAALQVQRPSASIRTVAVTTVSLGAVDGQLMVDIHNPNGFSVPLSGIDWELSVGGARAVRGHADLHQDIPANASAPVTVTLRVSPADAIAVAGAVVAGRTDYRLHSTLTFSTPLRPIQVDLDHQGTLGQAAAVVLR